LGLAGALVVPAVTHAGSTGGVLAPMTTEATTTTTMPAHVQYLNLDYATKSPSEKLDLYMPGPSSADPRPPLVVYTHGGAWESGDKANWFSMDWVDKALLQGYAIASVNYRLSNPAVFPAQIYDVTAAVRWLRANAGTYGYDPNRFVAIGDSAGGNLVGLLAVSDGVPSLNDTTLGHADVSTAIKAAVLFYAPIDLLKGKAWLATNPACRRGYADPTKPGSPESKYLGAPILTVPTKAQEADPVTYLS
jgi:acetyl esterase/lipase